MNNGMKEIHPNQVHSILGKIDLFNIMINFKSFCLLLFLPHVEVIIAQTDTQI